MKKLIMILSLLSLLCFILMTSFCSKSNLTDLVNEFTEAMNNHDVKKVLTFLADDIVFEMSDAKITGKEQVKEMLEFDAVNNAHLINTDIMVEGNIVTMKHIEKNDAFKLMGIDEYHGTATMTFRDGLIEKIKLEDSPESRTLLMEKEQSIVQWASEEHPEELKRLETGEYTAENAKLMLSLLKEWKERTKK
ncbi:MAG: nuclear transport factor 2 family protein [Candidatus Aminicenantes bacterium]|nr:nuclear transport factor 2 family protein [Candidatus Aminicenantes bacterium]